VNFLKGRFAVEEMEAKLRQGLMQAFCTGVCALKSFWNPSIGPLTPATVMVPRYGEAEPIADPTTGMPLADEQGPILGEPPSWASRRRSPTQRASPVQSAESQGVQLPPGRHRHRSARCSTSGSTRRRPAGPRPRGCAGSSTRRSCRSPQAKERFPKIADKIRPLDARSSLTYERMAKGGRHRRAWPVQSTYSAQAGSSSRPMPRSSRTIREYWEMRSAFFPKGRLIVVVGGAVAYDGPWPQGVFPYAPIFGEPGLMTPYGRPPVNDMLSPQTVINREWTAIARKRRASGHRPVGRLGRPGRAGPNPARRVRDPAGSRCGRCSRTGRSTTSSSAWIRARLAGPLAHDRAGEGGDLRHRRLSRGLRGQIPPGLDSGVAIQYLLEQETAQLKDAVDAVKRSLILWGRHQLAIARWGYGDGDAAAGFRSTAPTWAS
jgi:hypothetical protein